MEFSIVVVNWRINTFLDRCLESLIYQSVKSGYEIIVVDNESSNESKECLERYKIPNLRIVYLEDNLGYAGGMNAGLELATGAWQVALNSDVVVEKDFIKKLRASIPPETHGYDMIAISVLKWIHSPELDHFTQELMSAGATVNIRASVAAWEPYDHHTGSLIGCDGSVQIFSRRMYETLSIDGGGEFYPEYYGSYYEDLNVYIRANSLGFKVKSISSIVAWHIGSASTTGVLSLMQKPNHIKKASVINKWRNIYMLKTSKIKLIFFVFSLAEDIIRTKYALKPFRYIEMHAKIRNESNPKYRLQGVKLRWSLLSRLSKKRYFGEKSYLNPQYSTSSENNL